MIVNYAFTNGTIIVRESSLETHGTNNAYFN